MFQSSADLFFLIILTVQFIKHCNYMRRLHLVLSQILLALCYLPRMPVACTEWQPHKQKKNWVIGSQYPPWPESVCRRKQEEQSSPCLRKCSVLWTLIFLVVQLLPVLECWWRGNISACRLLGAHAVMPLPNPSAAVRAEGGRRNAEQLWSKEAGLPSNSLPGRVLKWGKETDINCICSCGAMVALPSALLPASIELLVCISREELATSVSCVMSSSLLLEKVASGTACDECFLHQPVVMDNIARTKADCHRFSRWSAPRVRTMS